MKLTLTALTGLLAFGTQLGVDARAVERRVPPPDVLEKIPNNRFDVPHVPRDSHAFHSSGPPLEQRDSHAFHYSPPVEQRDSHLFHYSGPPVEKRDSHAFHVADNGETYNAYAARSPGPPPPAPVIPPKPVTPPTRPPPTRPVRPGDNPNGPTEPEPQGPPEPIAPPSPVRPPTVNRPASQNRPTDRFFNEADCMKRSTLHARACDDISMVPSVSALKAQLNIPKTSGKVTFWAGPGADGAYVAQADAFIADKAAKGESGIMHIAQMLKDPNYPKQFTGDANKVVWQRLSQALAEDSVGTVYVVLPAKAPNERHTDWFKGTIWDKIEYPNMGPNVNKIVRVDDTTWTENEIPKYSP